MQHDHAILLNHNATNMLQSAGLRVNADRTVFGVAQLSPHA